MRRLVALMAALILSAASLAACGSSNDTCEVAVNGAFGSPVTVDLECDTVPGKTVVTTTIEGTGNPIVAGQTALIRATSFDSRDGKIIESFNSGNLRLAEVTEKSLGDLAESLVGVKEGSRLVIKNPGLFGGNRGVAEIVVVDVLSTVAHGTATPLPSTLPPAMPTVSVADGGGPSITATGAGISELAVIPLVTGDGSQVKANAVIFAQYAIYSADGTVLDTTWNGGSPVAVDLSDAMEGLKKGLVDSTVGSRVVVLVPSAEAQGNGDRIVIVDILGVATS